MLFYFKKCRLAAAWQAKKNYVINICRSRSFLRPCEPEQFFFQINFTFKDVLMISFFGCCKRF